MWNNHDRKVVSKEDIIIQNTGCPFNTDNQEMFFRYNIRKE